MKLVSVIVPAYKSEKFINRCIDHVLDQTFTNFEIVVVYDKSPDNTLKLLKEYGDKIRLIIQDQKLGVSTARHIAMENSKGEYIAFCDADDYWAPTKLERQLMLLNKYPEVGLCYTHNIKVDKKGNEILFPSKIFDKRDWLKKRYIATSSVCFRRKLGIKAGNFNKSKVTGEDFDMWLRISKLAKLALLPEYLTYLERHSESMTAESGHEIIMGNSLADTLLSNDLITKSEFLKNRYYGKLFKKRYECKIKDISDRKQNIDICFFCDPSSEKFRPQIEWFRDQGFNIHIIDAVMRSARRIEGISYDYEFLGKLFKKFNLKFYPFMKNTLLKSNIKIIHSNNASTDGFIASKSKFHPHILSCSSNDILKDPYRSDSNMRRVKYSLSNADIIIVDSEKVKKGAIKLGIDESKIEFFPWSSESVKKRIYLENIQRLYERFTGIVTPKYLI
jgi:glycosyltransferase involved in cell wall biosynthesis